MTNPSQNGWNINEKSMLNPCSKKGSQKHARTPEIDPTRQPESIQIPDKQGPKINAKKEAHRQRQWEGRPLRRGPLIET